MCSQKINGALPTYGAKNILTKYLFQLSKTNGNAAGSNVKEKKRAKSTDRVIPQNFALRVIRESLKKHQLVIWGTKK